MLPLLAACHAESSPIHLKSWRRFYLSPGTRRHGSRFAGKQTWKKQKFIWKSTKGGHEIIRFILRDWLVMTWLYAVYLIHKFINYSNLTTWSNKFNIWLWSYPHRPTPPLRLGELVQVLTMDDQCETLRSWDDRTSQTRRIRKGRKWPLDNVS